MKPTFRACLLVVAVMVTAQLVAAEEWRGIKPLSSTRADVVRVFGECSDKEKPCEFTFEDEEISIEFSNTRNCNGAPADIVLWIKRMLRDGVTIEAAGFDKRRFKSIERSFVRKMGYRAYVNEKSGSLFKTFREEVFEIYYIPTITDGRVCPYSYNARELLQVYWPHVFWVDAVNCPATAVDGEKVSIDAVYQSAGQWLLPTWYSTGGRIVAGQGTRKIVLDTTGLAGRVFTVTVEVNDGNQHIATGNCSIKVIPNNF